MAFSLWLAEAADVKAWIQSAHYNYTRICHCVKAGGPKPGVVQGSKVKLY